MTAQLTPLRRVYVAGHTGLVGQAIVRRLRRDGFSSLLLRTRQELDLTDRTAVLDFFAETRPEFVVIAAAKVGGIAANVAAPVEFLVENLRIQTNLLEACVRFSVQKVAFLGSSCIYPREAPQPMKEQYFMTGPLEPTNESYAIAKIAGIRHARALWEQHNMPVLLPMPSNVYGPGDHFDLRRSHVVSALVMRMAEAVHAGTKTITLWGSGRARRELLHVDDLADAVLFLMEKFAEPEIINVGTGADVTIAELAALIAEVVGFDGDIEWDTTKPDGMPQKLLDVTRIHELGWRHRIELREGIATVLDDYRSQLGGR